MDAVIPATWQRLTAVQRDILCVLAARGEATVSDISAGCGDHPAFQTVSRNLATLRGMGYVESEAAADDQRYVRSRLTAEGEAVVRRGVVDVAEAVGT